MRACRNGGMSQSVDGWQTSSGRGSGEMRDGLLVHTVQIMYTQYC